MTAEDDAYYAQQELYQTLDRLYELEEENQRLREGIETLINNIHDEEAAPYVNIPAELRALLDKEEQ